MTIQDSELRQRAADIQLVLLDVDGVLTDGKLYLGNDGSEFRTFFVRDGLGIKMGQKAGLQFGIVSGRDSVLVQRRAEELGIESVHQGVQDKGARLDEIVRDTGISAQAICFVGDDLIDIPALRRVGLAAAPADACEETQKYAHFICKRDGGRGAVREVIDLILRASDRWESTLQRFMK